jgi:hypothetical protein
MSDEKNIPANANSAPTPSFGEIVHTDYATVMNAYSRLIEPNLGKDGLQDNGHFHSRFWIPAIRS